MKLYYAPGACSLSPHIVARELDVPVELVKVDMANKKTEHGDDYLSITPKGLVPLLVLDDGATLTEGVAIIQYLANVQNDTSLIPPASSIERYKLLETLNYITSELHKTFSPLFKKDANDEVKKYAHDKVVDKLKEVDNVILNGNQFAVGDKFSLADPYLFTVLNWASFLDIDLPKNLKAYQARIAQRPAVQQALKEEGLA